MSVMPRKRPTIGLGTARREGPRTEVKAALSGGSSLWGVRRFARFLVRPGYVFRIGFRVTRRRASDRSRYLDVPVIDPGLTRRAGLRTLPTMLAERAFVAMQRLRTIKRFVRALVALFLVAQLAGVVASPLSSATQTAPATHVHHHHADGQAPSHHQSGDHADYCCALHAFFAGVMPPAVAVEQVNVAGERSPPKPLRSAPAFPPIGWTVLLDLCCDLSRSASAVAARSSSSA